jgi:hypothetical protein
MLQWGMRWPDYFVFVDFKNLERQALHHCQGNPKLLAAIVQLVSMWASTRVAPPISLVWIFVF